MNSKYRMIEVDARNIDDMVSELLEYHSRGEMVSTVFNEKVFCSDTVTIDNAYIVLTGKTKAEFEEFKKTEEERMEKALKNPNHSFHSFFSDSKK